MKHPLKTKPTRAFLWAALVAALWLTACAPANPPPPGNPFADRQPTPTPFQSVPYTPTPVIAPTFNLQPSTTPAGIKPAPTIPPPDTLSIYIPPAFAPYFTPPPAFTLAPVPEAADLRLEPGGDNPLTRRVYALAAPFPTVQDGLSSADLQNLWQGSGPALLMTTATRQALASAWGKPAPGAVTALPANQLLDQAWAQNRWAILPFENLEPRWKTLAVDGQSPLRKDFDLAAYPLAIPYSLHGDPTLAEAVRTLYPNMLPPSNRAPAKLTTLAMTGVTALVRATAWTMEQQGVLYPGRDLGDWLRSADLTHISNEVPFAENCPFPNPVQVGVTFCSSPRYLALLEDVGTDIIELTGDHFHDWGWEAMLYTLDLYDTAGLPYYGGGATYDEGKQAVLLEHNGNRFAFIGCNGKRGSFAQASAANPGSVACDIPWVQAEIARLTAEGYLVIATFQHFEYYTYAFPAASKGDFWAVADAGAVIASGSQAHHPHGFEFRAGGFIHYGLGNLFFDQYGISPGTVQGFVDRHVFYDGKHLGTELLTFVFEDYARARPMTAAEREALLRAVFNALTIDN